MYAAGSSLAIVAVIFVIWLTVQMPGTNGENQVVAIEDQKKQGETESLMGSFGDGVGQVFTGFKNAFGSVKEMFSAKESYESNPNPFQTE